ncbi:YidC/Oxa1 family membrane protein insertase [Candidatus Bipolaricaulota sp. J31]
MAKFLLILFTAVVFACIPALGQLEVSVGASPQGGKEIVVENALVRYRFWERGGVLASGYLYFAPYGTTALDAVPGWVPRKGDKGFDLVQGVSLPLELWPGGTPPAELPPYELSYEQRAPHEVVVRLTRSEGELTVEKAFVIAEKAVYTAPVTVKLVGEAKGLRLVLGHLPQEKDAPGLVYLYDGEAVESPLAPGSYERFEGLGLVGRLSVFFWKLEGNPPVVPFRGKNAAGQPVFGLEIPELAGELDLRFTLYAGRNRYILLEKAGLEGIVELGFFSRFLVGVIKFLEALYHATGNYGWAIVLFTLTAQVFLFPLTRSQIRSMAKMQRLQPKIQRLQRLYKDDKEALQKHLVELYRQEKVNPLGGCMPLLLQFPFLILLWQSIFNSAELFHLSPPFLWIPDLSLPDPYYIIIALTVAVQLLGQWFTTRRAPIQAGGGTQLIGWIFPLFFAFMFRNFPAGLWLYWFLYSSIQSIMQAVVHWELARAGVTAPPQPRKGGGDDEGEG